MHTILRTCGALFAALIAAFAIAGPANAATATKVQIVQQSGGTERALGAAATGFVFASPRQVDNRSQQWLRRSAGGEFFTYESVFFPGKCLSITSNSTQLRFGTCSIGDRRQMWTQGFSGAVAKKLQNAQSGLVATFDPSRLSSGAFHRVDQGLSTQKWRLVQG